MCYLLIAMLYGWLDCENLMVDLQKSLVEMESTCLDFILILAFHFGNFLEIQIYLNAIYYMILSKKSILHDS